MITSAAFEPCVTDLCPGSSGRESNGIIATCRAHRDARQVGFGEIHGHIYGRERTRRELRDLQADHEENMGYGKAGPSHPTR